MKYYSAKTSIFQPRNPRNVSEPTIPGNWAQSKKIHLLVEKKQNVKYLFLPAVLSWTLPFLALTLLELTMCNLSQFKTRDRGSPHYCKNSWHTSDLTQPGNHLLETVRLQTVNVTGEW